ncbi:MAG: HesA/MoeB/ThiF family protein [Polyangiaceae bacterium]|nr:HesA/MoeB/ThiF family protein [Polyangiaceae bacterium]
MPAITPPQTKTPGTATGSGLGAKSALIVGMGGLGCPAATILAQAGVGRLYLVDDDVVEQSNLHRQTLFCDTDVGRDKLDAARDALIHGGAPPESIELIRTRLVPSNARKLASQVDVVLEGADNFATKFLCADACFLETTPVVHAAAIRCTATVLPVSGSGAPCYRCLFEDVPDGEAQPNCNSAGVLGPVVGLAGALLADHALRILTEAPSYGFITTYDGNRDRLRPVAVNPRVSCPLCGDSRQIKKITETRYTQAVCAA